MNTNTLQDFFDVVVMLTWSNWKTEPRSNRYHYASRLARQVPVLFVQPKFLDPTVQRTMKRPLQIEPSDLANLSIVHYDHNAGDQAATELFYALRERGFTRPLVWIYNVRDFTHFLNLIDEAGNAVFVFHATENYFAEEDAPEGMQLDALVKSTCRGVDLVVGVSERVTAAYKRNVESTALFRTVENGCDFRFAEEQTRGLEWKSGKRPIAVYQGGVNGRLDYRLLHELIHRLPEWNFWFCGREDANNVEWSILKTHPNVRYLGELTQTHLARTLFSATVGLIPFVQSRWIESSLPLKSFEYASYGLPVVSVPIDALSRYPDLFARASTANEFVDELERARYLRSDQELIDKRRAAAELNSYDRRFEDFQRYILDARQRRIKGQRPLNVVMLYDERSSHINTIYEHIEAFRRYSHHHFYFVPATGHWPAAPDELERAIDLTIFDVIVVHYSVRLRYRDFFSEGLAKQVERHNGFKILFIQDEYDDTEVARQWMERLRFNIVYTCVPERGREKIYPKHRFPGTEFRSTLTGYVPQFDTIDQFALPIEERHIHIGYRGRVLPFVYGILGHEKYRIGVDVRKLAEVRSVPVDIEVEDSKRIYGDAWYQFLGSSRATLGTESGSSIFDFTGEVANAVARELKANPNASFDDVQKKILCKYESPVAMNQISPKLFEAIRLRTALILFEGTYSDVVQPDLHYIPLKKDYSNIEEVFRKLEDLDYLKELTTRAYKDVIESGAYSYRKFVEGVDADIAARHLAPPRCEIFASPCLVRSHDGRVRSVLPNNAYGFTLADRILGGSLQREQVVERLSGTTPTMPMSLPPAPPVVTAVQVQRESFARPPFAEISLAHRSVRRLWRVVPEGMRQRVYSKRYELLQRHRTSSNVTALDYRLYRRVFRLLPARLRNKLVDM